MSRARSRSRRPAPAPPATAPQRRAGRAGRRRALWIGIAALAIVAAIAAWALRPRRAAAPPTVALNAPEPLAAGVDPWAEYRTAIGLCQKQRELESLPHFRRAMAGPPGGAWQPHFDFGSALCNVTLRIGRRDGVEIALTRSSWERAACLRAALDEFATAERLCRNRRELGFVRSQYARVLWVWGLPWETLAAFRTAQEFDPATPTYGRDGDRFATLMHHPELSNEAEPAPPGPIAAP